MTIQFNKKRYFQLLKEKKNLDKEGRSLWYSKSNRSKSNELTGYITSLTDQSFWESRHEFIKLLNSVLSNKISIDEFMIQFCGLRSLKLNSANTLIDQLEQEAFDDSMQLTPLDIQLNSKSYGLSDIISFLHNLIDLYDPDVTLEMNLEEPEFFAYGISEEWLKLAIKTEFLPKLKSYDSKS